MSAQIRILDNRKRGYFATNDQYIDHGYAATCGWKATLVYMSLCRHANQRTQEAFPTVDTMAKEHGVDRKRIIEGIKTLIEWNLLAVKKERSEGGKFQKNTYVMLDVSEWRKIPNQVPEKDMDQVPYRDADQVPERDYKEHKVIKEHNKLLLTRKLVSNNLANNDPDLLVTDQVEVTPMQVPRNRINDLLAIFSEINPTINYGNKTERSAAQRLLDRLGEEKTFTSARIAVIAFNSADQYAPSITTPLELEKKMAKLVNFYKRNSLPEKSYALQTTDPNL